MTAKPTDSTSGRAASAPSGQAAQRKPWKKKTPVEVVLDQINRLRDDVAQKEEELKTAKKQLVKLEELSKGLEST